MSIAKLAKDISVDMAKSFGLATKDRGKFVSFAIAVAVALYENLVNAEWVPTAIAVQKLGGISSDMLEKRIESGEFIYGEHYVNAIDSKRGERSYYLWNTKAIIALWKIPPHERCRRNAPQSTRILNAA